MRHFVLSMGIVLTLLLCASGCANNAPEQPAPSPMQQVPSPSAPAVGTAIASYETPVVDKTPARLHNIDLAIKAVNEAVVPAGEIFSFNEVVGPRTPKRGYQKAIIFIEGKKEKGYGGGICQVSSNIYTAALEASLEVVERHPHELEVDYAQPGKDATVSYGDFDLKIKNSKDYPIRFQCSRNDQAMVVTVVRAQ